MMMTPTQAALAAELETAFDAAEQMADAGRMEALVARCRTEISYMSPIPDDCAVWDLVEGIQMRAMKWLS